jgi:hypothetical protein
MLCTFAMGGGGSSLVSDIHRSFIIIKLLDVIFNTLYSYAGGNFKHTYTGIADCYVRFGDLTAVTMNIYYLVGCEVV